jgi:uncharacterized 2Fe-2S/4Fe-4S cluster protein (DUF4445 family)
MLNPQIAHGDDVMSRISYVMNHQGGLEELRRDVIGAVNSLLNDVCRMAGIATAEVADMVVVGNTCMHHLFLGLRPDYLGRTPFTPVISRSLDIKARELDIDMAEGAYVHTLPIEAGFVGADNVAVLIAQEPYNQDDITLIIDIGTNGELILGNRHRLLSASCATGPALEGAHIRHGMRAAPGAIEHIRIDPEDAEVRFKVFGCPEWRNEGAVGLCGSAIIDVLPELLRAGLIDKTGRFIMKSASPRLRMDGEKAEFVIAWAGETAIGHDIVITQDDVRAIQLAKGAMYAGAKILMRRLDVERLDRVVLAGAFGSYIDRTSAAWLGLFPDCDPDSIQAVGNAAGDGARLALLDAGKRAEAEVMAGRVEYVELTTEPDFDRVFAGAMWLPHMQDEFPHLKA